MTDIRALIAKNQERWDHMKVDPARRHKIDERAAVLVAPENKSRFQAVERRVCALNLNMRWWFVAVVAEREYGGPPHWDRQLAQGDLLNEVSYNDPAGRGPFLGHPSDTPDNDAWVRGALDALIDCPPHAAHWPDWTPGGILTLLEEYNGLGYAARGVPSAYVWSGSNQYVSGKFVADHVYRAGVIDVQEGCAPLIEAMRAKDPTIQFGGSSIPAPVGPLTPTTPQHPVVVPPKVLVPTPGATHPSLWELLLDAYRRL